MPYLDRRCRNTTNTWVYWNVPDKGNSACLRSVTGMPCSRTRGLPWCPASGISNRCCVETCWRRSALGPSPRTRPERSSCLCTRLRAATGFSSSATFVVFGYGFPPHSANVAWNAYSGCCPESSGKSHELLVDLRIARFLALDLFHLLGYRRVITVGRRLHFIKREYDVRGVDGHRFDRL